MSGGSIPPMAVLELDIEPDLAIDLHPKLQACERGTWRVAMGCICMGGDCVLKASVIVEDTFTYGNCIERTGR